MPPQKKTPAAKAGDYIPNAAESREAFAPALDERYDEFRSRLASLRPAPPQVLHLEGGDADARAAMAIYWAALLNCPSPSDDGSPCLECRSCLAAGAGLVKAEETEKAEKAEKAEMGVSRDIVIFDSRKGNVKVENVRGIKSLAGEAPREENWRVVIFLEAQNLNQASANALLKPLEDPSPHTRFVYTMPQREAVLPTIVSRGFVMTLPWIPDHAGDMAAEWTGILENFFATGRGLFDKTAAKGDGALKKDTALEIGRLTQKALAARIAGRPSFLSALPGDKIFDADELISFYLTSLSEQVNLAYAAESLLTGLFILLRR